MKAKERQKGGRGGALLNQNSDEATGKVDDAPARITPKPGLIFGDCDTGFGLSVVLRVQKDGTVDAVNSSGNIRSLNWETLDHDSFEHVPHEGLLFDLMAPRIAELFKYFDETKPYATSATMPPHRQVPSEESDMNEQAEDDDAEYTRPPERVPPIGQLVNAGDYGGVGIVAGTMVSQPIGNIPQMLAFIIDQRGRTQLVFVNELDEWEEPAAGTPEAIAQGIRAKQFADFNPIPRRAFPRHAALASNTPRVTH